MRFCTFTLCFLDPTRYCLIFFFEPCLFALLLTSTNMKRRRLQSTCLHTGISRNVVHLKIGTGTSLAVQWSEHHAFTAEGTSSVPGQGAKVLQAVQHSQKKKKKKRKKRYKLGSVLSLPFSILTSPCLPFHLLVFIHTVKCPFPQAFQNLPFTKKKYCQHFRRL